MIEGKQQDVLSGLWKEEAKREGLKEENQNSIMQNFYFSLSVFAQDLHMQEK